VRPSVVRRSSPDAWTALLLAAGGVAVRVAAVRAFPAAPKFDSQALIAFGRVFHDRGLFPDSFYWSHFNPGLPMILALLDGPFARHIAEAARTATAAATGLLGVLPFLIWRPVLAYRWRLLAGLLLTFWPGQVLFSGIVTQDNWVLLPGVALCALAARTLRDETDTGRLALATLLFLAAVAIRQEMLIVLFLPWLASAAGRSRSRRRVLTNLTLASVLSGIGILALCEQRYLATGRFTIATEHGGLALLGSVVPGSFTNGWLNPRDYVAAVEPSLLGDPIRYRTDAYRLSFAEIRRHPLFQGIRAAAQLPHLALVSEAANLDWSMTLRGALPPQLQARGEAFRRRWDLRLKLELGFIQGLALAALLVGFWRRDRAILVIAAAAFLKVAIHLVLAPVPRLILPAIAFELLTIPLAASLVAAPGGVSPRRRAALAVIAGAVPVLLLFLVPPLEASVMRFRQEVPRVTEFTLAIAGGGSAACTLESGKLVCLDPGEARLETPDADPPPGDTARVVCRLPPLVDGESLTLRLEDTYAAGGFPERMIARVSADGRAIFHHDLAASPGRGWIDVPLAGPGRPAPSSVSIEEVALRPEPGASWGASAPLGFAFRR
jgi:hypothetical protein